MKKTVYISFFVLMVIMTIVNFLNFSDSSTISIFDGLSNISIKRPENMSNKDFVEILENISKKQNIDIAYQHFSTDAKGINIYKTNNTNDFMNINTANNIQQISDNQCISTISSIEGYQVVPLYISSFVRDTTIYTFDKCVNHRISPTSFMIKENGADKFIDALNDVGIKAELNVVPVTYSANQYDAFDYSFCLFLVVLLAVFISFIDNAKTHTLKRLEGYSTARIMAEESIGMLFCLLIIFTVVEAVSITFFAVHNIQILDEFILFNINSLLKIYLPLIVLAVLLSSLTVMQHSNNLYIKGKVNKSFILYATATVKTVAFVFMCAPFITAVIFLPKYVNSYQLSAKVNNMLTGYVEPLLSYTEDNFFAVKNFYNIATEDYGAVFFEDRYNPEELEYYSENFEQNYNNNPELNTYDYQMYVSHYQLSINSNYLKLNPLHKPNGDLITEKDFPKDKYNVLVSEDAEHIDAFVKYIQVCHKTFNSYKNEELPINIVYYKGNEKFLMLNSLSSEIYVKNPYVTVIDGLNQKYYNNCINGILNSSASFILLNPNSETDDLYEAILPLIEETGIKDIVYNVTYANEGYAEELANNRNYVLKNFIQVLIYGSLYIFLMIYFIRTYSENYQNDIAVRKLSGENFFRLHSRYFSAVATMIAVTFTGVLINQKEYITVMGFSFSIVAVPLALWVIEIFIFVLYTNRLTHKNILKALKGGKV